VAAIKFKSATRLALFIYLALITVAVVLAVVGMRESAEMPGLQAVELVLLALPWSFALGIEPLSHLGWTGNGDYRRHRSGAERALAPMARTLRRTPPLPPARVTRAT
jgi:hypothetical protein